MQKDLWRQIQPSTQELVFLLTIVAILTALLIYTDISIHDTYIKQIIAECYPENQNSFCMMIRGIVGVPDNAQLEIGSTYWAVLLIQAITLSFVMFLLRMMIRKLSGQPFSPLTFFTALLWGFTTFAFYYFGWLDFGYFVLRGLPVPEVLPWLDGVGAYILVQPLGLTSSVDKADLFLLMGIGVGIVAGLWALAIHHQNKGTLKKWGLTD